MIIGTGVLEWIHIWGLLKTSIITITFSYLLQNVLKMKISLIKNFDLWIFLARTPAPLQSHGHWRKHFFLLTLEKIELFSPVVLIACQDKCKNKYTFDWACIVCFISLVKRIFILYLDWFKMGLDLDTVPKNLERGCLEHCG